MDKRELLYDWNQHRKPYLPTRVDIADQTLSEGLLSPTVRQPSLEEKLGLLHLMNALGLRVANLGRPAAGAKAADHAKTLARECSDCRLDILLACTAEASVDEVRAAVEVSQEAGVPMEVHVRADAGPIRQYAGATTFDRAVAGTRDALLFAATHDCVTTYGTEDAARSDPGTLHALFSTAVDCGARRLCLCDTSGHAAPNGARALVHFVKHEVIGAGRDIGIDWYGRGDRGLALANALAAMEAGADRLHATALGLGPRSGTTPVDLLLVNLRLLGVVRRDLCRLRAYCEAVANSTGHRIPPDYPVVGKNAFRTGSRAHAAGVVKARAKAADRWICDEVCSGVRPSDYGFAQSFEIGPQSGKPNVECWLHERGIDPHPSLIDRILARASKATSFLTNDEVIEIVQQHLGTASATG